MNVYIYRVGLQNKRLFFGPTLNNFSDIQMQNPLYWSCYIIWSL